MKKLLIFFLLLILEACDSMGVKQVDRIKERQKILNQLIPSARKCFSSKEKTTITLSFYVFKRRDARYFENLFNRTKIDGQIDPNFKKIILSSSPPIQISSHEKECIKKLFSGTMVPMLYFTVKEVERDMDTYTFSFN